jgi:carboxypeptidase family protein
MKVVRAAVALLVFGFALTSCGPQVPPAGNYATVTGVVVDASNNAPIAGATVTVNVVSTATTDATGNFRITTIPSGPWQYTAQAPNYQAKTDTGQTPLMGGEQRYLAIQLSHT